MSNDKGITIDEVQEKVDLQGWNDNGNLWGLVLIMFLFSFGFPFDSMDTTLGKEV